MIYSVLAALLSRLLDLALHRRRDTRELEVEILLLRVGSEESRSSRMAMGIPTQPTSGPYRPIDRNRTGHRAGCFAR